MTTNHTSVQHLVDKHKEELALSSGPKEAEPIPSAPKLKEIREEDSVDTEVEPYVEVKSGSIKMPPDVAELGVEPKSEPVVFPKVVTSGPTFPLSDEEIVADKLLPPTNPLRWTSEMFTYMLAQAHYILKKVGGKITRVKR